jgi:23S rRNA pseudouridine955/2504/2580 synthase
MTEAATITVIEAEDGIRLDRWFRRHYPELGHGRLQKLLRTGQVRVDGKRVKAGVRLAVGQRVRVPPLGEAKAAVERPGSDGVDRGDAEFIRSLVLHIDDDVIVLDKPSGLAVQGGTRTRRHLDAMLDALRFGAPERPRLVHRLDKDTSGVLVLARGVAVAARLGKVFRSRAARKVYWALTVGVPSPAAGRIDLSLEKRPGRGGERVAVEEKAGKRAVTLYRVVEAAGNRIAWLALRPLTGRTHQLRAHCAALGCPILGDGKYGGRGAFIDDLPEARRLHLHAREIVLPHPSGKGELRAIAPLPPHMRKTWEMFGFDCERSEDFFAEPD